jgi:hypothetical protein
MLGRGSTLIRRIWADQSEKIRDNPLYPAPSAAHRGQITNF